MKEPTVDTFAQFIYQRSRLSFAGHKRSVLKQCLEERRTCLELPDLDTYWGYVRTNPSEESLLFDLLTTNETFFFRNSKQFDFLRNKIIPDIEEERGQEVIRSWGRDRPVSPHSIMKLRILCAGCSTGEEPYSVAMTLLDVLKYPKAWDIEILAGDLSDSCIASAMTGYYENMRLKVVPSDYVRRFMERTDDGAVIKDEVKRLVRFCRVNLGDIISGESFPGYPCDFAGFDVIFCRNVMIYFASEGQQQLVDTLSRFLQPGGYLFTGDAEPLHLYDHNLDTVREAGCLIYRKTETSKDVLSV